MESFRVEGGRAIRGEARVSAAKNAVLPLLAASILTDEDVTLCDCPDITDATHMLDILRVLGCRAERSGGSLRVNAADIHGFVMPDRLSKKIRSSIFLLGPILARFRKATVTYPGGCEIGLRPIDLHLTGLRQLGVKVREEGGLIHCDGADMRAGDIHFDYPSVGATENVMMAAAALPGRTRIQNAAREPEIEDLQRFLNAMGGRVRGAGTQTVTVEGGGKLAGVRYEPIKDRIAAGTLLAAAAVTGGELSLLNAPCRDMAAILTKLREMGCDVREEPNRAWLKAPARLNALNRLITQPHPGFPTDMQVQMLTLCAVAQGTSIVIENVFENRFTHAGDLNRLGANIVVSGRMAIVQGVRKLRGDRVQARDLRGGAALLLAGLCAAGETVVENVALIDRGYDHLEETLTALGANVRRENDGEA